MKQGKNNKQPGIVLISTLLMLALFALLTTSLVYISTYNLQIVGNIKAQLNAQKATEAGIEYAMGQLNSNPYWGLKDPNGIWYVTNSTTPPSASVRFPETNSEFYITFDRSQKNHSYNNLTNPFKVSRNLPTSQVAGYNLDLIVTGKCGSTTKIIRVMLARDDLYPYTINSYGSISFKEAKTINISGEKNNGGFTPGIVHSNYKDSNPLNNSISKHNGTNLVTNHGFLSAKGRIDMMDDPVGVKDPNNTFDCSFMKRDEDITFGKINIQKDILDNALARVNRGDWTIKRINPALIKIRGEGYDNHLDLSGGGLTYGVDYTISGDTIYLTKDLYIDSPSVPAADKNKNFLDILYDGTSCFLQRDSSALYSVVYNSKGKPTYKPRTPKINLNGHKIFSEGHLTIGASVTGEGALVSNGKLTYVDGVNSGSVSSISNDDLSIQLDSELNNQAKGLFYSNDDFEIKPLSNTSPLYAPRPLVLTEGNDNGNTVVRSRLTLGDGYVMSRTNSLTPTTIVGDVGLKKTPIWVPEPRWHGDQDGGSWQNAWVPQNEGNTQGIVMSRVEEINSSQTYILVSPGKSSNGINIYSNSSGLNSNYGLTSDVPTCPTLPGKNVNFGDYSLILFPQNDGTFDTAAMKNGHYMFNTHTNPTYEITPETLDQITTEHPSLTTDQITSLTSMSGISYSPEDFSDAIESIDPPLSNDILIQIQSMSINLNLTTSLAMNSDLLDLPGFPDITSAELNSISTALGKTFYMDKKSEKVTIDGVIVAHNVNNTETLANVDVEIGNPTGELNLNYDKGYLNKLREIRGDNFGVRISSWQELKP